MSKMLNNQKGVLHPILLIVIAFGIIAFIVVSNVFDFNSSLFDQLFPKPTPFAKQAELSEEDKKEQQKLEKFSKVNQANGILKAHASSLKSDRGLKNKYKKQLAEAAKQRKEDLKELMKIDPTSAKGMFFSDDELQTLREAEIEVEEKTSLEGEFRSYHIETLEEGNPVFQTTYHQQIVLGTSTNQQIYDLHSDIDLEKLGPDSQIKIEGFKVDDQILVTSATKTGDNVLGVVANPGQDTQATIPMLVIIGYTDGPNAKDLSFYQNIFSGEPGQDVDSYFKENTYGKTAFTTSFYGPYKVPSNITLGISSQVKQFLQQSADTSGADFTKYKRILYLLNNGNGADGAGSGLAGTEKLQSTPDGLVSYADVWIGAIGARSMYFHELGHAFGNAHAEAYNCGKESFIEDSRYQESCVYLSYGDQYDVMGGRPGHYPAHYNALHKDAGGWFSNTNLLVLDKPGTYTHTISPIETSTEKPLALFIPRNAKGDGFSVEFKQPIGFDSWLNDPSQCINCNATKGVLIKYNKKRTEDYVTFGLDTTPNSRAALYNEDLWDSALEPGKTFTDSETGITITTNSISQDGANVTVVVPNTSSCVRNTPKITATTNSQSGAAGPSPIYALTITNNDSNTCPSEQFKIEGSRALGRYNEASPDNFVLKPGESKTISFKHIIPTNYPDGSYPFTVTVCPNTLDTSCGIINLSYQVNSPTDSQAPTAPTNLNTKVLGSNAVSLNWSASSDNTRVSGYNIYRDGAKIATLQIPNSSYIDSTVLPSSNYTYTISAFDQKRNESAKSNNTTVTTLAKTDNQLPDYPTTTTGTPLDSHSARIELPQGTDNTGIIGYRIYRQDHVSTGFKSIVVGSENFIPASQTSFIDYGLISGTKYKYYIEAVDGYGNFTGQVFGGVATGISTVFTPQIGTQPTSGIQNFGAFPVAPFRVVLIWDSIVDTTITKYEIYRTNLKIAETTNNYYIDTNVIPGVYMRYNILAVDSNGNRSITSTKSVISPAISNQGPAAPTVNITSPSHNNTVSDITTISLDAKDDGEIVGSELYVNNILTSASTVLPEIGTITLGDPTQIKWNTKTLPNGQYTITAKVYDTKAQGTTSSPVTVNINNTGTVPVPSPIPSPTPSPFAIPSAISSPIPSPVPSLLPSSSPSPVGGGIPSPLPKLTPSPISSVAPSPIPSPINYNPKGAFESANATSFEGWGCDENNYGQTINIHFYKDGPAGVGTYIGSALTNVAKNDVASQCGGNTSRGFKFNVPASSKDNLAHTIYAYAINIPSGYNPQLLGSPKTVFLAAPLPSPSPIPSPLPSPSPKPSPDTSGPSVNITSPNNADTLSGTVNINADATDPAGIARVEFWVDGVLKTFDAISPYTYALNTITLANGTHTISVKALDIFANTSIASISINVVNGDTQAPTNPANLTGSATTYNRVNLSWTASSDNVGVAGYYIIRNNINIGSSTSTSYVDSTVSASSTYTYQVIAYDEAKNNSNVSNTITVNTPSAPDIQAPTTPSNLTGAAISSSQINLSWNAASDNVGVVGYQVFRNNTLIATITTTSFGDTGLSAGTNYTYYVKAKDGAGNVSNSSNLVTINTPAIPVTFGSITGIVTSSLGSTIYGAKISIYIGGVNKTVTTNSLGVYTITNVPNGTYNVAYSAKKYATKYASVSVNGNTIIQNITLQATGGGRGNR